MGSKSVVIVSASSDPAVSKVVSCLRRRGIEAETVYTDQFPGPLAVSLWTGGDEAGSIQFASASRRVLLLEADAVWIRRIRLNRDLPTGWGSATTAAVRKQSLESLVGLLSIFDGPVLDPLSNVHVASAKPLQLERAQQYGLRVPRTLISNDPCLARKFVESSPGLVVAKPVDTLIVARSDGGTSGMYTSILGEDELHALDEIRWCPMILQDLVPKVADVRVTVVGDDVFAASLPYDRTAKCETDWRSGATGGGWVPHTLPDVVADGLLSLVRSFGLTYSAADFIRTVAGEYMFLESNPGGEWTWLEEQLDLGIPDSIASLIQSSV